MTQNEIVIQVVVFKITQHLFEAAILYNSHQPTTFNWCYQAKKLAILEAVEPYAEGYAYFATLYQDQTIDLSFQEL